MDNETEGRKGKEKRKEKRGEHGMGRKKG